MQDKGVFKLSIIKKSKVLVTGGAGFIGSNLVDSLIKDNEVVVVDDLSMGKVENLPKSDNLHFFKHSITDECYMQDLLINWNFDYIFLLAAVASVADTVDRPRITHEINQNANLNVLETIRTHNLNPRKVVFTSSAAVYGNNPELPKVETSPIDPLTPYAIDKFATERFVIDYGNLYGISTVSTRFFNVFGPKQNPSSPYSGVISLINDKMKLNEVFSVFGDGEQKRDFIFVTDVVKALILLASQEKSEGVYNVATGKGTTLNEVISMFEHLRGKKLAVSYGEKRVGDIKVSVADISKIQNLGFYPEFSMAQGLRKYISFSDSTK